MKRPSSLGSVWFGDKYVHGPRVRRPSAFRKFYVMPKSMAVRRGVKLPKLAKIPVSTRLVVGVPKRGRGLKLQSFITPKRSFKKVVVKPYLRKGMYVSGSVSLR